MQGTLSAPQSFAVPCMAEECLRCVLPRYERDQGWDLLHALDKRQQPISRCSQPLSQQGSGHPPYKGLLLPVQVGFKKEHLRRSATLPV